MVMKSFILLALPPSLTSSGAEAEDDPHHDTAHRRARARGGGCAVSHSSAGAMKAAVERRGPEGDCPAHLHCPKVQCGGHHCG